MALCVSLQVDGTLLPTGEAVGECTAYVLASPAEIYAAELIAMAFQPPDLAVAAGWFSGVFSLVLIVYVSSRAIGAVVNSVR